MHQSIKLDTPCEFINVTSISPLISKCQIKVCYVGDEPNRNGSVITKEVAIKMGQQLPGSPIVGYFNENQQDFEEHNRSIDISNGKFEVKDTTKPYGFVAPDAKIWFAKYSDDGVEHEYLMTEGYLWTGQYPECQRIIDKGNNQSMELDENSINADWSFNDNGEPEFFIINEAVISKLCILGENVEPCFEGSQITKIQFSFEDDFKKQLFSMMNELKDLLNGGEPQMYTTYAVEIGDSLWNSIYSYLEKTYSITEPDGWVHSKYGIFGVYEEGEQKFAILCDRQDNKFYRLNFSLTEAEGFSPVAELEEVTVSFTSVDPQFALSDVENFEKEFFKKKDENEDKKDSKDTAENDNNVEGDAIDESKEEKDDEEEKDKQKKDSKSGEEKKKYNLDEVEEYVALNATYAALQTSYDEVVAERDSLKAQVESLTEFKKATERTQKEQMMKEEFYMLSDEDKADVLANIDNYSLGQIEEKLSVICVRNRVQFSDNTDDKKAPTVFNFNDGKEPDATPAWVKAVVETAKTM